MWQTEIRLDGLFVCSVKTAIINRNLHNLLGCVSSKPNVVRMMILAIFTLETDNPSKSGYPSSTDNPSLCENGTVFIVDG